MKRVTYKSIIERQQNQSQYAELPKLKDIIVDLSVRSTPKVVRKLRLVGLPIEFIEYSDKKRVPGEKGKTYREAFPDADTNNKITRIGHEDPQQCPWKEMGYVGSKKYAIRCMEETVGEDKVVVWTPKILCKGPSVFGEFATWEMGRIEEDDPAISTFLGGDEAPVVRVNANKDDSRLGGVAYTVHVGAKDVKLTEAMIDQWRAIREPSADELNTLRSEYNADREEDPSMPEWRDYFEFGFDLRRIFKHTPVMNETTTQSAQEPSTSHVLSETEEVPAESESAVAVLDKEDDGLGDLEW